MGLPQILQSTQWGLEIFQALIVEMQFFKIVLQGRWSNSIIDSFFQESR